MSFFARRLWMRCYRHHNGIGRLCVICNYCGNAMKADSFTRLPTRNVTFPYPGLNKPDSSAISIVVRNVSTVSCIELTSRGLQVFFEPEHPLGWNIMRRTGTNKAAFWYSQGHQEKCADDQMFPPFGRSVRRSVSVWLRVAPCVACDQSCVCERTTSYFRICMMSEWVFTTFQQLTRPIYILIAFGYDSQISSCPQSQRRIRYTEAPCTHGDEGISLHVRPLG